MPPPRRYHCRPHLFERGQGCRHPRHRALLLLADLGATREPGRRVDLSCLIGVGERFLVVGLVGRVTTGQVELAEPALSLQGCQKGDRGIAEIRAISTERRESRACSSESLTSTTIVIPSPTTTRKAERGNRRWRSDSLHESGSLGRVSRHSPQKRGRDAPCGSLQGLTKGRRAPVLDPASVLSVGERHQRDIEPRPAEECGHGDRGQDDGDSTQDHRRDQVDGGDQRHREDDRAHDRDPHRYLKMAGGPPLDS